MRNKHCVAECQQYLKDQPASNKTLCGLNAELRGRHQKIISYCFFGNLKSVYYDGIQDNLKSLDKYYPGWIMRLYLDPTKLDNNASNNLCTLSCDTNRMDVCSVKSLGPYGDISGKFGMVWRFLPMADPFVDFMVSRDLDSRFSVREKSAVDDWISSG
ncbi:uncharacterized protein LOC111717550, partial [Eurytemora carolleeae]|uniref:uncharacterized protein LOC111717550 n=1 Tax=Eurytemora carolleeae TaxID=1294199 RepID=UPI000C77FDD2